jgi:drug/metabolite transporter (DMT)-like permease
MMITKFKADLGLLSITVFWGTTFILSKLTLQEIPLPVFLFLRLTLAAAALNLFALKYRKYYTRQLLVHGSVLGVLLYLSYFFQMWGIQYTSASNAGFITGLSVIMVPMATIFIYHEKPAAGIFPAIILAITGLLLLTGMNPADWNKGDILVLICTVSVTFHVIYTGRFAPRHNVYLLTSVQLSVLSILTLIALPFSDFTWPHLQAEQIAVLCYLALFGTVFTFLMQTAMQRFTTTTRTALVFSMEPVFAALFAWLIAGEAFTGLGWIGGGLIVLAMVIAEMPLFQKEKAGNSVPDI